jgi:hypothetical protein
MSVSPQGRLALIWSILVAVTLLAWWIGAHHGAGRIRPDAAVAVGAITITLVKVRLIMREFMLVRTAPARLKHVTDAWLAIFGTAMLIAYFA